LDGWKLFDLLLKATFMTCGQHMGEQRIIYYFYQAIKRGIRVKRGIRDEDYQKKGK
jgi:hypothetical protein